MPEVITLSNGLRLAMAPMSQVYSATTVLYVSTGSRYETSAQAGSSHLLEHMLFKGTERRPTASDISETIEGLGGSLNASTDKETTNYYAKVASEDLPVAIDLLSDMLLSSRLLASEVQKEKRVVIEELNMAMDAPQDWVHTLIEECIWPGQPLGRDVAGTRESVSTLTRSGLLGYYKSHYLPENSVISVAGNFDPRSIEALVEEYFGSWHGNGERPQYEQGSYPASSRRVRAEYRETEQANLCLALPGISHSDPRRYAFDLLNNILGGTMISRLFIGIREQKGLVYDIHSYIERLHDTGSLVVYAGMDPANIPSVVTEILTTIDSLRRKPVSDVELQRMKRGYRGRLALGLEDTASMASWCGGQEILFGRIESPEEVLERIHAVTPAMIQEVATALFAEEYLRLAVIGSFKDERIFEELLHF